jgi:hypothetical protein
VLLLRRLLFRAEVLQGEFIKLCGPKVLDLYLFSYCNFKVQLPIHSHYRFDHRISKSKHPTIRDRLDLVTCFQCVRDLKVWEVLL